MICLPILFTTSLRFPSLIVLIKFCLMCRMQYTWAEPVSCQPFLGSLNALLIDSCLSETMQMDIPFVTCLLRFFKKKLHPSFVGVLFIIYFILSIYKCCAKKKTKKKSQSRQSKRREWKKKIKKTVQSRQPVTVGHVSSIHSVPPFETAGMKKKTEKKNQKWKWVILEKKISEGVRLEIFFANKVKKKILK